MQIFFFVIAVGVTGIASMYNLCNGFIDEATWMSLGLSLLVILAWLLWVFVVISRSARIKSVVAGADLLFIIASAGCVLYTVSGDMSSDIVQGTGLACGTFFVLPFAGFTKLTGTALNPLLAIIPYAGLILLSWVIAGVVKKSGMADRYLEKKEEKYQRKIQKKTKARSIAADEETKDNEDSGIPEEAVSCEEVQIPEEGPVTEPEEEKAEDEPEEEESEEEEVLRTRETDKHRIPPVVRADGLNGDEEGDFVKQKLFEEIIIDEEPEITAEPEETECP